MNTEIITANVNQVKLVNKQLAKATDAIYKIAIGIKRNLYEIAHIIATVDADKCYTEDGFENVHQWTQQAFGFKKSMSYSLLKIGKEYTRVLKDSKTGRVTGYTSNLLPETFEKEDFTTTQVGAMLPLGHDKAKEEVDAKNITPDMSVKDIKKYIKSLSEPSEEPVQDDGAFEDKEPTDADIDDMAKSFNDTDDKYYFIGTSGFVVEIAKNDLRDIAINSVDMASDKTREIIIRTIANTLQILTGTIVTTDDIIAFICSYTEALAAKRIDNTGVDNVDG